VVLDTSEMRIEDAVDAACSVVALRLSLID
jgi:hypothetical protein